MFSRRGASFRFRQTWCSWLPWRGWGLLWGHQGKGRWSRRCPRGNMAEARQNPHRAEREINYSHQLNHSTSLLCSRRHAWMRSCEHLVEPRGHDEERRRGLVSSRGGRGRQVVALQDVLILGLALVELVVLPSDSGHLKHVTQNLSSCTREDRTSASQWRGIKLSVPPMQGRHVAEQLQQTYMFRLACTGVSGLCDAHRGRMSGSFDWVYVQT